MHQLTETHPGGPVTVYIWLHLSGRAGNRKDIKQDGLVYQAITHTVGCLKSVMGECKDEALISMTMPSPAMWHVANEQFSHVYVADEWFSHVAEPTFQRKTKEKEKKQGNSKIMI